ncbi:hypothetical protein E8E13_007356 [Curvularia kusanoi]|uniref:Uncharacterized protein n=1 Tax=Curvularia kusanoi TaxID=90978 RepID=A0A9P4WAL6_CURKU|nr:hypothetical protein E8E13_007356 [Curvularia kusanoi]
MSTHKRQHSGASGRDHQKKPYFKSLDEAIAVMLVQNETQFPGETMNRKDIKARNDKLEADEREKKNFGHGIFSLPAEVRLLIYEQVHSNQVLQVTAIKGQARLANSTHPEPLALLSVCRLIRQEAAVIPFNKATFQIVTFRYVSMLGNWRNAIRGDPDVFLNFLESIPAPYIRRFQVVGVMGGSDRLGRMATSKIQDYRGSVDHKAELESLIREIYPEAEFTFNDVADIGQLRSGSGKRRMNAMLYHPFMPSR